MNSLRHFSIEISVACAALLLWALVEGHGPAILSFFAGHLATFVTACLIGIVEQLKEIAIWTGVIMTCGIILGGIVGLLSSAGYCDVTSSVGFWWFVAISVVIFVMIA